MIVLGIIPVCIRPRPNTCMTVDAEHVRFLTPPMFSWALVCSVSMQDYAITTLPFSQNSVER